MGVPKAWEAGALAWWAGGAVALLTLAAVWSVDYLPTHDGPQHVFGVHVASRLDDTSRGWGRFLEPALPVTNNGFALVFGPFDRFLPWRTALKLAQSAILLTWCLGALLLARALHPGRAWLGVALAAGAFQWSLYMGFFSFQLATGLALVALAVCLGRGPASRARHLVVSGLLLVSALSHVAPALLAAGAIAGLELWRGGGARGAALLRGLALGTPALAVAAALVAGGLDSFAQAHGDRPYAWSPQRAPLWALARGFFAGPAWRAWPPLLLAVAATLAAPALRPRRPEDRALAFAGAALLLAAVLAPLHVPGWDFFSLRFLPLAVPLLVVTLPLERLQGGPRRAATAALAGFALASSLWALGYNRDLASRAAPALAGLDAELPRSGPRMPIVLDPYLGRPLDDRLAPVPYAVPLLNLGQLYAAQQGGFAPFTFAHSRLVHPVVWRAEARRRFPQVVDRRYAIDLARRDDDDALRAAVTTYLAGIGTHYQDVILWGREDDAARLEALGFVSEFRRGGLVLARYRGCPLTLVFPAQALPPEDAKVELGWLPAWHVTHRYRVARGLVRDTGELALPLEHPPCGGAWLRLVSEQAGTLRCDGADAEGRLLIPASRDAAVVECRLPPRAARSSEPASPPA